MHNLIRRNFSLLVLAGVSFIGAFSRLTSGRYTPQWYAYQLERAPNTRGTWFIPAMDILLGLLFPRRTRTPAVMAITVFFGLGLGLRVVAGKDFTGDAALLVLALLTLSTTW
ncbi:hypothetical protein C8F04DRAFT_245451 [Mycena alexandri]|uniref:Uncharacterized protein n=1 Tax=Mycena alexandri TaxID=1745969 RepID=A0AAD6S753_9AGAR|nr:hypothetical protein C8F04DRAFT_245451 [Mycena alexandri]